MLWETFAQVNVAQHLWTKLVFWSETWVLELEQYYISQWIIIFTFSYLYYTVTSTIRYQKVVLYEQTLHGLPWSTE